MVVRGVPAGTRSPKRLRPGREEVAVGRLLPELHADLDALAEHAVVAAAHRPRLEEQRGGAGARQLVGHRRDRAAALVPAALGGVAHREPVGHGAGGERGEEGAPARGRDDDHGVRVEPAGRHHEPAVPGRRSGGGERLQGRRTRLGGGDARGCRWSRAGRRAGPGAGRAARGAGRAGRRGARPRCGTSRPTGGRAPARPSARERSSAAAPRRSRRSSSVAIRSIAAASAAFEPGGTSRPSTSWVMISRGPEGQSYDTGGTPADIASCRTSG